MSTKKNTVPFGFKRRNGLKKNRLWKYGQKATIGKLTGISRQQLGNILHGRSRAKPIDAAALEEASRIVGNFIPSLDWIYSLETTNPLFENGQSMFSTETDDRDDARADVRKKARPYLVDEVEEDAE